MAFVALYDANVLYPNTVRDLLIRIGMAGLVQAKWTDRILDETFRNLTANRPDLTEKVAVIRQRMMGAVRDCLVTNYEPLIDALDLPDPDDRHVLAAAIRAKAQVIVTYNLKDFPEDRLSPWDVEAKHPDAFVEDQIDLDAAAVYACVRQIADSMRRPPGTVSDVLDKIEKGGLVASAAALRAL
ncbi:PIN domain-containing protein [Streptomyces sp. WMMB 322]|uniref:PIN domain-containing protein n=1 Tax=Streptomyces sp. WMMB 322 TaxID=1286821 RepID=UPI0006E45B3B|nr:PIN domain-containing protein [Streptomyces sp. WMMB 322]SCK06287.1 Predicted nucleic acid-binding protein, contains PIN domain [Streptomyces sp. WMMB 322]